MTIRVGFDTAAQRALDTWRIVTTGLVQMAPLLPRDVLFLRQGERCYLCATTFRGATGRVVRGDTNASISRDHVFPRSGNGGTVSNLLLAHKRCNGSKGDRWPYPCEVIYLAAIYAAPAMPRSRSATRKARAWARRT